MRVRGSARNLVDAPHAPGASAQAAAPQPAVPVEISLSPLQHRSGLRVVAVVRDITTRVAADTEAAAHVRTVLDATRDPVLMFDLDTLRLTHLNQGAITHLGYNRDEVSAMGPLHITQMFSEAEFRALIDSLSSGQSHSNTTAHRRTVGTGLRVEAVLQHPADDRGDGSPWMVSIALDLTASPRDRTAG